MRTIFNNKGVSLVVLIVIMLGIALIGGGVAAVMGSKQKSYPFALNSFNAYQIANAGAEFAIRYYKDNAAFPPLNTDISFGGGTFTLSGDISPNNRIISTGTYSGVTRQVTVINFSTYAASSSSGDVSFDNPADLASFAPMESQSGQVIVVNPSTGMISLGQGAADTFGAIWYGGNAIAGNCVNGSCDFGSGFRAYFVFQFATGSTGDGFTFAVINGTDNDAGSLGGDTRMGELMAYGGDSRKYDSGSPYANDISSFSDYRGFGIRPPKFATEFDIHISGCGTVCSGTSSRCDTSVHHMAYVFWGDNNVMGCAPQDVGIYLRWMPNMYYAKNTVVRPETPNNYIYRTTNTGTSASAHPVWPTGKGGTVTESTGLQWKESAWRNNQNYNRYEIVAPTNVSGSFNPAAANGHFYFESRTGTRRTGGTEPDWTNCTDSGTCDDNAARWQDAYARPDGGYVAFQGNSRTYDDNRHGDGTGGDSGSSSAGPTNTTTSDSYYSVPLWSASTAYAVGRQVKPGTSNGYYYVVQAAGTSGGSQPAWPTSGSVNDGTVVWVPVAITNPLYWLANTTDSVAVNPVYAYRMEVVRDTAARTYRIKSWIKTCTDGTANCDIHSNGTFGNVSSDYVVDSPTLDRAITLDSAYNTAFNKFLFGWTVASGGATQIADIRKFRMSFKP